MTTTTTTRRALGALLMGALSGAPAGAQATPLGPAVQTVGEPFSAVEWVRVTSDGGLWVADPLERSLLLTDLESGQRWRVGREGRGPGEYLAPLYVAPLPGDSTLVSDPRQGRFLIVAPDGGIARTVTPRDGARAVASQTPRAADARGFVYLRERDGGNIMMTPGMDFTRAAIHRLDPATGESRVVGEVATVPDDDHPVGEPVVDQGGLTMTQMLLVVPRPWSRQEAWGVLSDGTVGVVAGDGSVVRWSDGTTTRLDLPDARVTDRAREAWYEGWLASESGDHPDEAAATVRISDLDWPERTSPFAALHAPADPQDRLWLRLTGWESDTTRYAVVDRGGVVLEVDLPAGARLVGFSPDRVWLATVDHVGLVTVSAHPLPPG